MKRVRVKKKTTGVSHELLERHHCRFPLWEDGDNVKLYCGNTVVPGRSYCKDHCDLCYKHMESGRLIPGVVVE